MADESRQRLQAMSHNLMMGFETNNAHIMLHQHGSDMKTLCNNMVHMFTDGHVKPVQDLYLRRQPLPVLRTSTSHNRLGQAAPAA